MPEKAALLRLMDRVAEADALPALYHSALACLQETLGVDRASVLVFDAAGVMRFVAWSGLSDAYRAAIDGHSPWPAEETDAKPVLVEDIASDPALAEFRAVFEREEIRSLAFIPVHFGSKLLGKFMLCYRAPHRVSADELTIAQTIAGHVAFALEHHRIAAELETQLEAEQAARRLADRQSALREVQEQRLRTLIDSSDELASAPSPEDALTRLARYAVRQLADYCVTYAVEGREIRRLGLAHRIAAKQCLVEAFAATRAPRMTDELGVGAVVRSGDDQIFEDVTNAIIEEGTADDDLRKLVTKLEPVSTIIVGLRARGETLGAIALVTTRDSGRRYGETDLVLAQEIAHRAALLIDNARLLAGAQCAVRTRDDMIAIVSHDLRSPLQSIATAAEVLATDPPPALESRSLESIRVATTQVDRLLQDLLDISIIDSGQLSLTRRVVDTATLLAEAHSLFEPIARRQNIELVCRVEPGVPPLFVDHGRILQALSNLLGNAMKFVPATGRVTLSAVMNGAGVRIAVDDNGRGIEPDHLPRVFDRLWRGPSPNQRGVGLGLAVTKGIVEAHGGRIAVDSQPNRGSSFHFVLEPAIDAVGTASSVTAAHH